MNCGRYSICDDVGVWVVVPRVNGKFNSEAEAQDECDRRNIEDGSADESGELYGDWPMNKVAQWERVHGARADCTCGRRK